jgi:hypothetical protein
MKKLPNKDLSGTYGWNVSNFIDKNNLYDLAREVYKDNIKGIKDMTNDEILNKIYEWDAQSGWEILGSKYIRHYPHPDNSYEVEDYSFIERIEDAEKKAIENAKYIFSIRNEFEIIIKPKTKN